MRNLKKLFAVAFLLITSFCIVQPVKAGNFELTKSSTTIVTGQSTTLKISGLSSKNVKWKSSKPSVVKVSSAGKITGKKIGSATITGTYKKIKFKCKVTVIKKDLNKTLYNDSNYKITLSRITKSGVYLKVKNKGNSDVDLSIKYIILDDEYHDESVNNAISPSNYERTLYFEFEDSIANINAKYIKLSIGTWDSNTGYIIKYLSIPKTKIR
jgi:phage tail sheath gpL-like